MTRTGQVAGLLAELFPGVVELRAFLLEYFPEREWPPVDAGTHRGQYIVDVVRQFDQQGLIGARALYDALMAAFPDRRWDVRRVARELGVDVSETQFFAPRERPHQGAGGAAAPPPASPAEPWEPSRPVPPSPISGPTANPRALPTAPRLPDRLPPQDDASPTLSASSKPGLLDRARELLDRFFSSYVDRRPPVDDEPLPPVPVAAPPASPPAPEGELREAMTGHEEEAAPARTLNAALFDEDAHPLPTDRPLRLEVSSVLRVNVGPVAAWSAVEAPQLFPDDVSAAIEDAGGEGVDLSFQSADFALDGAGNRPVGEWQVVERGLFVPARGSSDAVIIEVRPLHPGLGYLRCAVYFRNALVQSLRLDAHVLDADGRAPLDTIPESARVGVAKRLETLGYAVVTEYTAAPGLVAMEEVPERGVSLYTNETWGTHALGVRVEGAAAVTKTVTLRPDQVGLRTQVARAALTAVGTRVEGDKKSYRYTAERQGEVPANSGTPADLTDALKKLARLGYQLYAELLPTDLRAALVPALKVPTTISVARLAEGEVLPWAVLYDRPLDLDDASPEEVCMRLLDVPADRPLDAVACRQRPDCPLQDEARKRRVVCPWGFWGLKHAIEQPPQRLDPGQEGRALVTRIDGPVRLDMNVFPKFSRLANHRPRVEALSDVFVYAGDDTAPGAAPALTTVRTALRDRELTAIYFYCHGGEIDRDGVPAPFLAVGKSRDRLLPIDLREIDPDDGTPLYSWPRHPLVFLNGCETAMLEPRVLAHFVDAFAERGAAGVIGTEVPVFEALATEVAEVFLRLFLREGRSVGEALRQIRHDLLRRNNPLGLVYTAYASADLRWTKGG